MQIIHDYLDNATFLDIVLTKEEIKSILDGQMVSEKKKLIGVNHYIGVRHNEEEDAAS